MQAIFQRVILIAAILGVTLFLYFLVVGPGSARYSIFKLIRGEAAPSEQLLAIQGDEQSRFAGLRLEKQDVPSLAALNDDYARLIAHVQPAVVSIDTRSVGQEPVVDIFKPVMVEMPDGTRKPEMQPVEPELRGYDRRWVTPGVGSGVFIAEEGIVITSHHVVEGVDKITVTTSDGKKYPAALIGADSTVDLAVLKLKNTEGRRFHVLNFTRNQARTGEQVLSFGNPYGLTGSVSRGLISGVQRRFNDRSGVSYVQTDAVMNPGNSGGPLTNIYGEVVGINKVLYAGGSSVGWQGIGLAVPATRAIAAYEDIVRLGERIRPYLGVLFNNLTSGDAEELGLDEGRGVLIYKLEEDSPARDLLETGDVVLEIAGKTVGSLAEAGEAIQKLEPGAKVKLEILRKSKAQTVIVKLDEVRDVNQILRLPREFEKLTDPAELAIALKLDPYVPGAYDRQTTGLPDKFGAVFVMSILPDSPLSPHIRKYDVIHEINGKPIFSEEEFYQALSDLPADRSSTIFLTRKRWRYYLELRPGQGGF
ncbi:MAG: serine protease Do [Verrucomicrobiales bacterium]